MPNWVNNELCVSGTPEQVTTLYEKLSAPRPSGLTDDAELISQPLSFWNIVSPDDKEAYFASEPNVEERPSELSIEEFRREFFRQQRESKDYWYNWNLRNWGYKWDAGFAGTDFDPTSLEDGRLEINFDTPWSPPGPIIDWMTEYCLENNLRMSWNYLEEQGWGGEVYVTASGEVSRLEWDIPQTHDEAERVHGECSCEYETEPDYWCEDCPPMIEMNALIQQRVNDFIAELDRLALGDSYGERFRPNDAGIALLRKTSMRILDQIDTSDGVVWTAELVVGIEKFRVENLGNGGSNNYSSNSGRFDALEQLRAKVSYGFPTMGSEPDEILDHFCLIAEAAGNAQPVTGVTYRHIDISDQSVENQISPTQFITMER